MCEMIVDLSGMSRNEVYEKFVKGLAIMGSAPGWKHQKRVGGGAYLVEAAKSVLTLAVVPLDPSAPRKAYQSPRGVRVALVALEDQYDPSRPPGPGEAAVSRLRILPDRTWMLEFEDCEVCAHNNGSCCGHAAIQALPIPHTPPDGQQRSGNTTTICYFCHKERHDSRACGQDTNVCVFCHVNFWSRGCRDPQCGYCTASAAA